MSNQESSATGSLTDWNSVDTKKKSDIRFLRLKTGNTYTIRLFHKPKELHRYYHNKNSALCANPDNCSIIIGNYKDEQGKPLKPKLRYAINVIDRADNTVKVLEAPAMVFRDFRKFLETNNIEPGGPDAPDFVIKVEGTGIGTKYSVSHKMKASPFTVEEKAMLKEQRYNLSELFVPTPDDKIVEALFGAGVDNDGSTEPAEAFTPSAPAAKVAAPAASGDEFPDF